MEYLLVSVARYKTAELFKNETSALRYDAAMSYIATEYFTNPTHRSSFGNNSTSSKNEFQYYIIGVYSFFALLFAIGLIMIIARKIQKACCPQHKRQHRTDSESLLNHQQQNAIENQCVNIVVGGTVDSERTNYQGHDDSYEYYSEISDGETDNFKDKPPDYEEPPSYKVVVQTTVTVKT